MSKTQGYEFYSFFKFTLTPENPYLFVLYYAGKGHKLRVK